MIIKKLRIILAICLLSGMILGCGAEVSDLADVDVTVESSEAGEELAESNTTADSENNDDEEAEKDTVNALGLPMRDGTALVVTVTECDYLSGKIWKKIAQEYEFDNAGRRLRYINYSLSDVLGKRVEYEYDKEGNLIKEIQYSLEKEGGELRQWTDYQYLKDDSENLVGWTECEYNAEGLMLSESEYDSDGRLIKETVYTEGGRRFDEDGNVQEFGYGIASKYEYDIMGNRSRRTYYDTDQNVSGWREEEYDDFENLILSAEYDAEGNIDVFEGYECDTYMVIYPYYIYKNEYDDSGNLVRQVQYDHEGNEMEVTEKTYDNAGNLIRSYYSDGYYEADVIEYEYDGAGNQIKVISDQYIRETREYDERNRQIKYTKYSSGEVDRWYEYEYKVIGVEEKDYPFDEINTAKYIYR